MSVISIVVLWKNKGSIFQNTLSLNKDKRVIVPGLVIKNFLFIFYCVINQILKLLSLKCNGTMRNMRLLMCSSIFLT